MKAKFILIALAFVGLVFTAQANAPNKNVVGVEFVQHISADKQINQVLTENLVINVEFQSTSEVALNFINNEKLKHSDLNFTKSVELSWDSGGSQRMQPSISYNIQRNYELNRNNKLYLLERDGYVTERS